MLRNYSSSFDDIYPQVNILFFWYYFKRIYRINELIRPVLSGLYLFLVISSLRIIPVLFMSVGVGDGSCWLDGLFFKLGGLTGDAIFI